MDPKTVLQERYPLADFSVYFRHLVACRTEKGPDTQEHHICPRKQFPEFAEGFPENLATLHIDDHAHAHRLLEAACGIKAPSTVWFERGHSAEARRKRSNALRGRTFSDEHKRSLSRANRGHKNHLGHKHSDESRKKISESKTNPSAETRRKLREAALGNTRHSGYKHSESSRKRMSDAHRAISEETREKMRIAARLRWEVRQLV